jgi:hypothetical protein
MKIKTMLMAVTAFACATAPLAASALSPRREAILYNKLQKQQAIVDRRNVKLQYLNGDITKAEKQEQVRALKEQIGDYADMVDELKASK